MSREERMAQNEVWFREVNERLEERALARIGPDAAFAIVCECALEVCTERVTVDAARYEEVRRSPVRFILAAGHEDLTLETVVARGDGFEIVEKIGAAAAVADANDPRQ